ncbi:F-box/kelch-repeat protein At3g06240-like [Argentina anserina]|uniref:F-box/kelch-repeat protein At3g06240-like n=1 Tax=Argentina anserina TaxID=57926 RepID=UPI0021762888|nr:F-box/kelch-repeat protein At3g06240-like [Potentilla anserina]
MENFNKLYSSEDFVEQVLLELPSKSLMRFQCVCNLWCSLIKTPSFVAKHLSNSMRASSIPILFKRQVLKDKDNKIKDENELDIVDNVETLLSSIHLCNEEYGDFHLTTLVEDLKVPLPAPLKLKHSSDLTIAGHCDGIICAKLFIGNVILGNPAMKEFKLVPKSFLLLPKDDFDLWSLDYELDCYSEYLGFGYDPKGNDYKIVRFVMYSESSYWFGAEVYTMRSNAWRKIETEYEYDPCRTSHVDWCANMPIYFNGICYWHANGYHMECSEFILSFDMGNELFHMILIPDLADGCKVVTLAKWKEFISLLTYQEQIGVPQSYEMWVIDNGSWTKYLTIGPVEGDRIPLLFWNSDKLLMVTDNDGHIVSYNTSTKILKYLPINFMIDVYNSQALVYVDSIVSINGGNILEDIHISAFYGSGKFYCKHGDAVDISAFYGTEKLEL